MSDQNLATVFGPNILQAKAEDPQSIMGGRQTNKHNLYDNLFSVLWFCDFVNLHQILSIKVFLVHVKNLREPKRVLWIIS